MDLCLLIVWIFFRSNWIIIFGLFRLWKVFPRTKLLRIHICYDRFVFPLFILCDTVIELKVFKRFLIYPNVAISLNFVLCPESGLQTLRQQEITKNKEKKNIINWSGNLRPMKRFIKLSWTIWKPIEFNLATRLIVNLKYWCFSYFFLSMRW